MQRALQCIACTLHIHCSKKKMGELSPRPKHPSGIARDRPYLRGASRWLGGTVRQVALPDGAGGGRWPIWSAGEVSTGSPHSERYPTALPGARTAYATGRHRPRLARRAANNVMNSMDMCFVLCDYETKLFNKYTIFE